MIQVDIALLGTALGVLSIAFTGLYKVIQVLYSIEKRLGKLEHGREVESQKFHYELEAIDKRLERLERYLEQKSSFKIRPGDNDRTEP